MFFRLNQQPLAVGGLLVVLAQAVPLAVALVLAAAVVVQDAQTPQAMLAGHLTKVALAAPVVVESIRVTHQLMAAAAVVILALLMEVALVVLLAALVPQALNFPLAQELAAVEAAHLFQPLLVLVGLVAQGAAVVVAVQRV